MNGVNLRYVAPEETTICLLHDESFLAMFHPAPYAGVWFVHVAALSRESGAAKAAREILEFVKERYPAIETILGLVEPNNRAVRGFARRIGFKTTGKIQTKRGELAIVEAI